MQLDTYSDLLNSGSGGQQDVKAHEDLLKENEGLMSLLGEREALLEEKEQALADSKDKLLRSYAEMENVMDRSRREAELTRKYSIQVSHPLVRGFYSYLKIANLNWCPKNWSGHGLFFFSQPA